MKRIFLLVVGAAVWQFLTPGLAQEPSIKITEATAPPQALALSVNGKCDYSEDGKTFKALKAGQVITQGAVVRTGAKARTDLFFRRIGTTVRLQEGTEVRLEKMTREVKEGLPVMETLLDLRTGRIFTVVRSLVPGSTFEIRNAAGRSVVEGGEGYGRYIITADVTQVTDKDSIVPLKVIGEKGITVIAPGQEFLAKDGKLLNFAPPEAVLMLINLDELQSLAEQLIPSAALKSQDDSQALILSVGENSTFDQNGESFKKLRVGHILTQGAVVRTGEGETVDLFLRRWGTTVRLLPNTELGLEKMTKIEEGSVPALETRLHLREGRIFCFIRIPVANSRFEVRTILGRTLLERAGSGRYDIRANGTMVTANASFNQLKMVTKNGKTEMKPGQKFSAEDGHLTPAAPSEVELLLIQMDEVEALAEELRQIDLPDSSLKF